MTRSVEDQAQGFASGLLIWAVIQTFLFAMLEERFLLVTGFGAGMSAHFLLRRWYHRRPEGRVRRMEALRERDERTRVVELMATGLSRQKAESLMVAEFHAREQEALKDYNETQRIIKELPE